MMILLMIMMLFCFLKIETFFDFFNLSAGCSFTCQYMIGTHDNDEDTHIEGL